MWATVIVAAAVLLLAVFAMSFNIVFRKKDFPNYDVGTNEEMRKLGIRCYKDVDAELHNPERHCSGNFSDACIDCKLYEPRSDSRTS